MSELDDLHPDLRRVLESAARLQRVVPDAVLVGGSAAAYHARHRVSFDHDHVLRDLTERYQAVLEAVEATDGWATSVRASRPPFTIMGRLGGVEAGLRQLRRAAPLETVRIEIPGVGVVVAPTPAETLRVKAYLDVVALADRLGPDEAARVLADLDRYYADRSDDEEPVATALIERLAAPSPRDARVIQELAAYKGLDPRWHSWPAVVAACRDLADRILDLRPTDGG
jgi:hypothetical protein